MLVVRLVCGGFELSDRRAADGEHAPEVDELASGREQQLIVESVEARLTHPMRVGAQHAQRRGWPTQVPESHASVSSGAGQVERLVGVEVDVEQSILVRVDD